MAYIDENTKNVGLGLVQGTSIVLPLRINTSDELLVEIIPVGSPLGNLNASGLKIDGNTKNVAGGVTDDLNQDITPLTVDEIVGLPCVRVEVI